MTPVELIALAASTSLLAGWRLYLVTLITGLGMKFGWVALPDNLQALDVLANNWVLAIAAVIFPPESRRPRTIPRRPCRRRCTW